eukprot:3593441-Pleurochrysis_carterae.AAC.1
MRTCVALRAPLPKLPVTARALPTSPACAPDPEPPRKRAQPPRSRSLPTKGANWSLARQKKSHHSHEVSSQRSPRDPRTGREETRVEDKTRFEAAGGVMARFLGSAATRENERSTTAPADAHEDS